jgi:hypothetical protein
MYVDSKPFESLVKFTYLQKTVSQNYILRLGLSHSQTEGLWEHGAEENILI